MTKINSKTFRALIIVVLFAPSLTLGAFNIPSSSPRFSPKFDKQTICTNIVSRTEKWEINMQERVNKLNQIRTERQNRFDDRKENRDERNANRKQENDKRWEEYFAKMEAKAQTDAQKQAVLNFKKAVLAAIQAKRTAIETANGIFKATVQQVINERKSSVDTLAAQFRTEVQAAIQKAKNDCSTGSDPVQVRETLRVAIKAARDKFQSGRQEIEKIQGKLEVARNAHQTAVKNAQTSFKTALETAKNIFKAAIGAPSPTPTPTPTISPTPTPAASPSPSPSVSPSPSPTTT